jgi:hypothetical protein
LPESNIISFGNPCVSIPIPTKIRRANKPNLTVFCYNLLN